MAKNIPMWNSAYGENMKVSMTMNLVQFKSNLVSQLSRQSNRINSSSTYNQVQAQVDLDLNPMPTFPVNWIQKL